MRRHRSRLHPLAQPGANVKEYQIGGRTSLYRYVHAAGLFQRRKQEIGCVLESVMECVDICTPDTFDVSIRAVGTYAHLDAKGRWIEPSNTVRNLRPASVR